MHAAQSSSGPEADHDSYQSAVQQSISEAAASDLAQAELVGELVRAADDQKARQCEQRRDQATEYGDRARQQQRGHASSPRKSGGQQVSDERRGARQQDPGWQRSRG
jgi:hypothetical protein